MIRYKEPGLVVSAVFAVYLMLMFPVSSANELGSINVDVLGPQGTNYGQAQIPLMSTLIQKNINIVGKNGKPISDPSADLSDPKVKISIDQSAQYPIRKVLVYLCKDLTPERCLQVKKKADYSSTGNLQEQERSWQDVSNVDPARPNVFPQSGNILTIVNLEVNGKSSWFNYWDSISRSSIRDFLVSGNDIDSVTVHLENSDYANLTKAFINDRFMIPKGWVSSIDLGPIKGNQPNQFYVTAFDQKDSTTEKFDVRVGNSPTVTETAMTDKEFSLVIAGRSGTLISNGVTLTNNPAPVCGEDTDGDGNVCDANLGETAKSCCRDCGCAPGSNLTCSFRESVKTDVGMCIDPKNITLIPSGLDTTYTSCELTHRPEFNVMIAGAVPADLKVQRWFYKIGGVTKTDISCKPVSTAQNDEYTCTLKIDKQKGCIEGDHVLANNSISALVKFGNIEKTLTTPLSDITLSQKAESVNDITRFIQTEFNKIKADLDDGIDQAKDLIDQCIDVIKNAVWYAAIMTLITAGLMVYGWKQDLKAQKAAGKTTAEAVTGSPQGTQGGVVVYNAVQNTPKGLASLMGDLAQTFLGSVGTFSQVGLSICQVAQTILGIYTKVSAAMTEFLKFQVCVKQYQNRMGNGQCDGGDNANPQSAVSAATSCLNQLASCSLDGMEAKLDQAIDFTENQAQKLGQLGRTGTTTSFGIKVNNQPPGQGEACSADTIQFDYNPRDCREGQYTIKYSLVGQDPQVTKVRARLDSIDRKKGDLERLRDTLIDVDAGVNNVNRSIIENKIVVAANGMLADARTLPSLTTNEEVKTHAKTIENFAEELRQRTTGIDPVDSSSGLQRYINDIDGEISSIKSLLGLTGQQTSQLDAGGFGTNQVAASTVFPTPGRYNFVFNCPGAGSPTLQFTYKGDCSGVPGVSGGAGTGGTTSGGANIPAPTELSAATSTKLEGNAGLFNAYFEQRPGNVLAAEVTFDASKVKVCKIFWLKDNSSQVTNIIRNNELVVYNYGSPRTNEVVEVYCFDTASLPLPAGKRSIDSGGITLNIGGAGAPATGNNGPTVKFNQPTNGQTVSGFVALSATATDQDRDLKNIKFVIHGLSTGSTVDQNERRIPGTPTTFTHTYQWNSTATANGEYTINVLADDGQEAAIDSVRVTVNN